MDGPPGQVLPSFSERRLVFRAVPVRVAQACRWVYNVALEAGLGTQDAHHCELAVDEACTNILEHGYQQVGPQNLIEVVCRTQAGHFEVLVIDEAPPYNPLLAHAPPTAQSAEDAPTSGWGVHFIRNMMHSVHYRYEDQRNVLTMSKRLAL